MASNLQRGLAQLRAAVRDLPGVAARELGHLARQAHEEQRAPSGQAWAPTKDGQPFDAAGHIGYEPRIDSEGVSLVSDHRAAPFARFGTRKMAARPQVPNSDDLGWWLPQLLAAFRARLRRGGRAG